tara:strand:- start:1173 stop:1331 length:159 start_codon:yes stop_codon:yes gene_type:complete
MNTSQALRLLSGLNIDEIREQMELSGYCDEIDLEELSDERVCSLAVDFLTDR